MALPINIEDLLEKRKVESNRIEFKEGWNPTSIYHSICAFANDIDNIGGGYILVGVREENGIAQRPVKGLAMESLDKIQREMVQFNQLIEPQYSPRISVEEVDGKSVLVIWVTAGHNRPYTVPADVNAKLKKPVFYIRYGTSSIEAKGEFVQNDAKVESVDIQKIVVNMSKLCPRYVQDVSKMVLENMAICLLRAIEEVSAQDMLKGIEDVSYKHLRRKYLDKLLEMGAVMMTMPDKPTSKKQKYILSELGQELISG